jgi:hypothetical protein
MSGYLPIDGVAVVGYTSERNEPNGIPAGYQQEIENGRVLNFQRMHGKDPAKQAVRLIAMRLPQNPPITVTASSGSVRNFAYVGGPDPLKVCSATAVTEGR